MACQLAMHAALDGEASAAIITAPERPDEAWANMLCAFGRLPHHQLLRGSLDEAAAQRFHDAAARLAAARLRALSTSDRQWQFEHSVSAPD